MLGANKKAENCYRRDLLQPRHRKPEISERTVARVTPLFFGERPILMDQGLTGGGGALPPPPPAAAPTRPATAAMPTTIQIAFDPRLRQLVVTLSEQTGRRMTCSLLAA